MSSAPMLPEWKLQLLERRRKEEEEARRREREQQDRMAKMPSWKREIIERRRAKQGSSTSFSEIGGPGGTESGAAPVPTTPPTGLGGELESSVLQEKIGPVHQNPFIQLEKRRYKESAPSESDLTNAKAKQIVDLYGQIPGVRTLRADNVIIIETVPGAPPAQLASERHSGETKSGSVESLNELLARRGGSVTEIRAGEVFIVKSALSRSVEDLNSIGRASLPEQRRGRVSKLMSRFSQEDSSGTMSPRPVRSLSTENLIESSYVARKPGHSRVDPSPTRQYHDNTPNPPRDLPGLTSPVPCTVASYRSQFEAKSGSGEAWPDSPPRRSPTAKAWNREAASPERGLKVDSSDSEASFEIYPAPPPALVSEDDVQGKALANLRLHSRNSFVVVPRRGSASPPPPQEPKQETSPSPLPPSPPVKPPAPTSCSSPGREQLLPDSEEPPEAEAMRRAGGGSSGVKEDVRVGGLARASSPHPAVQRRSGNTITINPRKAPVAPVTTAVENGIESDILPVTAPVKKRYPTAEEIQVIGGYLSLQRSCLAKNDPHRKKLKISFCENQLERTFQYPSEGSLLEEFGPPEESESLTCTNPHGEDDEEEEELLLLHRGLPGLLRTKPLIVDESCRR